MKGNVLITGCSKGIGLALAAEFAKNEWEVCATARKADAPRLVNLAHAHPNVTVLPLDVLHEETIAETALAVGERFGSLDILVNNAAIFPGEGDEPFERLDLDWMNEAFDSNVTGPARVSKLFLPLLRKSTQSARIVNISSLAGSICEKNDNGYYPYAVSKAALNMLTRAMAAEFSLQSIIVTALSPGWVKTEMGGPNAEITAQESAESLYLTITGLTMSQSGKFYGRDGETYPW